MPSIVVVGNWHLAFVTAASLANQGHEVVLVNPDVSNPWGTSLPKLNIHEPGLDESLARSHQSGRLTWANFKADECNHKLGTAAKLPEPSVLWLAVDTPLTSWGAPDVSSLLGIMRASMRGPCASCGRLTDGMRCHQCTTEYVDRSSLVIVSSQVPVGFCQKLEEALCVPVAYVPENLQLGKALHGFHEPDRLVIGATDEAVRQRVADILMFDGHTRGTTQTTWEEYQDAQTRRRASILMCDLPTAEMIKHATNAFLATSISFANEMAKVGEAYGADNQLVAKALKMDSRIGPKAYVRPGLGFAGGTLPRDLHAMRTAMLATCTTTSPTPLIDAVLKINDDVFDGVARTIHATEPEVIVFMGYTYKPDTDTLRCSPVDEIVRRSGWSQTLLGYGPRMANAPEKLAHHQSWQEIFEARQSRRTTYVVVTPLEGLKTIPWEDMGPGVVVDLCDGVDRNAVLAAGLSYKAIWQPIQHPARASA